MQANVRFNPRTNEWEAEIPADNPFIKIVHPSYRYVTERVRELLTDAEEITLRTATHKEAVL